MTQPWHVCRRLVALALALILGLSILTFNVMPPTAPSDDTNVFAMPTECASAKESENKSSAIRVQDVSSPIGTTENLLEHESPVEPQEKFITFYTHSGFQNQLIQVENALMLAWYTNRTLLLPRALLGKPFGWSPLSQLQFEHLLHEKLPNGKNTARCAALRAQMKMWGLECPDPTTYTLMPYDELFSFDWARKHIRVRMREEIDDAWMEKELGLKRAGVKGMNGSYVDGDVRFFNGTTRYDWRIFDDPTDLRSQSKYEARLDVTELRSFPERLLHFGSLFGTGKMPIRDPLHFEFLRKLRRSLIYNHPVVLGSAESIVERMGGAGGFVGLHIRTSDGVFAKVQEENIHTIINQLHRVNASAGNTVTPPSLPLIPTLDQCLKASADYPANLTLVYVATDARSPRSNPVFAPLYAAYPCSFSLDDFLTDSAIDWSALITAKNPYDGVRLDRYLIPMVDGTVAARARVVVGSKGSTFSGFIYQMHDVFWAEKKAEQWLREEAEENVIRVDVVV